MEIANSKIAEVTTGLTVFPAFCKYIKENHFHSYVRDLIYRARQFEIPILKYFSHLNDEELFQLSAPSYLEFFDHIIDRKASFLIEESIRRWMDDNLDGVSKHQIAVSDIQLICHIREEGLINLLPEYTTDPIEIVRLTHEIKRFFLHWEMASLSAYSELLKEQIEDHAHFIHRLNDATPGVIYVYDLLNKKITYLNEKAHEFFGKTKAEIISMGQEFFANFIHPDDIEKVKEFIRKTITSISGVSEVQVFELRGINGRNIIRYFRTYNTVFKRDANGQPTEITGIVIDVSKEKEIARKLETKEEELQEAQELADIGTFQWNLRTLEGEYSNQVEHILNLSPKVNYETFLHHIHPGDRSRMREIFSRASIEKGSFDTEFRYCHGEVEKIIWTKGRFMLHDGQPILRGTLMDVTERHHIIERLQRSDDLYKQAQAMTHIGNYTYDLKTEKYNWTEELYRIYGLNPLIELTLENINELHHFEDQERIADYMERLIATRQPQEIYYRIVMDDGSIKFLHAKGEVLTDDEGKAYKIFGTVQDVTIQKLFELRLEENQNFIQKVADAAPSIIHVYNTRTGEYIFINKAIEQILGYDPKEIFEKGNDFFFTIIHPDDLPELKERHNEALEKSNQKSDSDPEAVQEFRYRMRHVDGSYHWFHTFGTVFDRDRNGKVLHVLNISLDISEQVNAHLQIEEQKHFIEHITNASPTIIYLMDLRSHQMIYINEEVTVALGYQPEEILEMRENVRQLFHPEDLQKLQDAQTKKKTRTKVLQFECRLKGKNKKWKWFLINETPFKTEGGEAFQILGAALDITTRKEMENALFEKTVQLQRSNASLEEFAYVASHDLKEPLRKISAFGDRLLTSQIDKLDDNGKTYLQKIIGSAVRMQQMVDDLLALSMISANKSFKSTDFNQVLEEILKTLEIKIEEKKAVIFSDRLPLTDAIPSQISQLFQNLLSNSLKFVHPDRKPVIRISCDTVNQTDVPELTKSPIKSFYKIDIQDNGIGFDQQYSEKIFSIFQRLHGRSEYEGTGIGLAICRKIAENHGGFITATSTADLGATFTLYLPKAATAS